jgi:uncharacterized protein
MTPPDYRTAIIEYIRAEAQPPDRFSHQVRLYRLAVELGRGEAFDDDVLFAAAWMHDLGVFIGHRPADPVALAAWDNVAYALRATPPVLLRLGFPEPKIPAVLNAIRNHLPSSKPDTIEGVLLRDADILEQLGAVGILRAVSKVGRDTRFPLFAPVIAVLKRQLDNLPDALALPRSRELAVPRIAMLQAFLEAVAAEASGDL